MKTLQNKSNEWQSVFKKVDELKQAAIEKSRKISPLADTFEWS